MVFWQFGGGRWAYCHNASLWRSMSWVLRLDAHGFSLVCEGSLCLESFLRGGAGDSLCELEELEGRLEGRPLFRFSEDLEESEKETLCAGESGLPSAVF